MKDFLRRVLRALAGTSVVVYLAVDGLINFLFKPLTRWLGSLHLFKQLGALIDRLPPYAVLLLLAIPFAIAEPAKIFAVYLITIDHLHAGLLLLLGAYLTSLFVVDRIYHAGKSQLHKIAWFAMLMDWLIKLRDRFVGWAKTTQAWEAAAAMKRRASGWLALWRTSPAWARLRRMPRSRS